MIDNFALAISHGLLLLGAWKLLQRRDLDDERPADTQGGWRRRPPDA